MFETYQFAGVYIAIQAVLTLYAQGKMTRQLQSFLKEPARGRQEPREALSSRPQRGLYLACVSGSCSLPSKYWSPGSLKVHQCSGDVTFVF